jgi:hypothetical protein
MKKFIIKLMATSMLLGGALAASPKEDVKASTLPIITVESYTDPGDGVRP